MATAILSNLPGAALKGRDTEDPDIGGWLSMCVMSAIRREQSGSLQRLFGLLGYLNTLRLVRDD